MFGLFLWVSCGFKNSNMCREAGADRASSSTSFLCLLGSGGGLSSVAQNSAELQDQGEWGHEAPPPPGPVYCQIQLFLKSD